MLKEELNVLQPELILAAESNVVDIAKLDVPAMRSPDTCQWKHCHKHCKCGYSQADEVPWDEASEIAEMEIS